jgi:methylthioribose-1-phosphate isomerase
LIDEAKAIHREDIESNMQMGKFGAELLPSSGTILTHCNAERWQLPGMAPLSV